MRFPGSRHVPQVCRLRRTSTVFASSGEDRKVRRESSHPCSLARSPGTSSSRSSTRSPTSRRSGLGAVVLFIPQLAREVWWYEAPRASPHSALPLSPFICGVPKRQAITISASTRYDLRRTRLAEADPRHTDGRLDDTVLDRAADQSRSPAERLIAVGQASALEAIRPRSRRLRSSARAHPKRDAHSRRRGPEPGAPRSDWSEQARNGEPDRARLGASRRTLKEG